MTCKIDYTANGSIVAFPFPFAIPADTALEVRVNDAVREIGFSIRGAGNADGGMVIFDSAPANGDVVSLRYLGAVTIGVEDAAAGHLADKLIAGANITLETVTENGGVQRLRITGTDTIDALEKSANLSDLADKAAARGNLGVYSKAETDALDQSVTTALEGKLADLSGVTNVSAARIKLDVYSKAEVDTRDQSATTALEGKLADLSGVTNVVAARTKLDVYSKAEVDTRDQSVTTALEDKLADLSGVTNVTAAQTKLDVYSKGDVDTRDQSVTSALEGKLADLSGVTNVTAAQTKLDVYSKGDVDTRDQAVTTALEDKLADLSGVTNVAAAQTKLGLEHVAYLNVAQDWSKPQRSQALPVDAVGGSFVLNFALAQNFDLTLNANVIFANPNLTETEIGQKGTIGIVPGTFSIAGMGDKWKRVGETGAPDVITGIGRIDYHIRALDRIEYAYNDVEA